MKLSDLRREFGRFKLDDDALPFDPVDLLNAWLDEAKQNKIPEFNAMVLSTVGKQGRPSSRIVLLKEVAEEGQLVFYTNYSSRKGEEIGLNPFVSVNFFWATLEKQIRVEGSVRKISKTRSEAYFNTRPPESRISAAVSPQSQVIESLDGLRQKCKILRENPSDIRMPVFWGGYEIIPDQFEFWQGGLHRLHDRFRYCKTEKSWKIERLAP